VSSELPLYQRSIAAGISGMVGWLSIYPVEVVKTRLMAQSNLLVYRNARDCVVKLLQEEGPKAFFRGIGVTLTSSLPISSVVLPFYELTHDFLAKVLARESR